MEDAVLKDIPKRKILDESRTRVCEKYMMAQKLPTVAAAQAALKAC